MPDQAAAHAAPRRDDGRTAIVGRLLTHPLLLLLVGGVISGVLATTVTQRWQDRQRAADTRRAFVTDMTRATFTDIVALDRLGTMLADYPNHSTDELRRELAAADAADQRWVIEAFTIRARLRAYYPGSKTDQVWTSVYEKMFALWSDEQLLAGDESAAYRHRAQGRQPANISAALTTIADLKDRENAIADATQSAAALVLRS